MENKSPELEVAIKAALEAGKILEKHLETEILKEIKDDKSIVTLADREAEEIIKKIIGTTFPEHSILGEETGMTTNNEDYVWHIDPIDGTLMFANGMPFFAVSVALVHNKEVIVAVVYNPSAHTLFYAEKGKGTYLNDKRVYVSKDNKDNCIVSVASDRTENNRRLKKELIYHLYQNVVSSMRDLGSTALDLAYVAAGGMEAAIRIGLKTYDFAAGVLLVEEAGGKITKLDGSPWKFPENYFIASNGVFHDVLVEEVKKQKEKLGIE